MTESCCLANLKLSVALLLPVQHSIVLVLHDQLSITRNLLLPHHAQDMLHAPPLHHSRLPAGEVGIFRGVPAAGCVFQDVRDLYVPDDEGEVRVGALVAHEPSVGCEMGVEDGSDAFDFVIVAFAGGREVLGVEEVEPDRLKEVGAD